MSDLRSGHRCPHCGAGRMGVLTSREKTERFQQQRLGCNRCAYRQTVLVRAEYVRRRGDFCSS